MKLNPRIATAIAAAMGLGATAANAATVSFVDGTVNPGNPGVYYSQQGQVLSGVVTPQALPVIVVKLGADYSANDNITLRIAGTTGPVVGGATDTNLITSPTLITDNGITCADAGTALPLVGVDATPPVIISFITRTGNDILLRVTQKNVANTVNVVCQIRGVEVTRPSLGTIGTVTAGWTATTAITNIAFDPGTPLIVASVVDQFTSASGTALNGVVNVNVQRTAFVGDDADGIAPLPGNEDALTWTANNQNGLITIAAPVATLSSVVTTVTGNFNFLDSNGDGVCDGTDVTGTSLAVAPSATAAVASNCQSIVLTDAAPAAGSRTYHLNFAGGTGKVIVAPQSFAASQKFNYAVGATTGNESDSITAGAWTLNGFQAFVNYMPYGGTVSQIIYIANKGSQSGAIQVDARNEAGTACSFAAGTVSANRVSVLSGAIKTGVETCYGAGFTGKVHMTITANIPSVDGEVYSAYNVGGNDRGTVVNTSNGR